MHFIETELFQFFWNLITVIIFIGFMIVLVKSGVESFKRARKWSAVVDEIIVGVIVIAVFVMVTMMPAAQIITWIMN